MTIIGNGVDIVENKRIKKSILNKKFVSRIYSRSEIKDSMKIRNKESFFAKRFAAKEAFVKALGTGFRNGMNFNDISVKNRKIGKPELHLNNNIKKIIKKKFKFKKFKIFLQINIGVNR